MDTDGIRTDKATQFLWIVQAGVLALAADEQRADPDRNPSKVARYSGSGTFIVMDEAVRAAGLIPSNKEAATAAHEFCDFYHARNEDRARNPGWFMRHGMEKHDYSAVGKAEQFLWLVQTVILADSANQAAAAPGKPERYEHDSVVVAMTEAIRASKMIPADMDVTTAANEFSSYSILGMREKRKCPKWYATS